MSDPYGTTGAERPSGKPTRLQFSPVTLAALASRLQSPQKNLTVGPDTEEVEFSDRSFRPYLDYPLFQ